MPPDGSPAGASQPRPGATARVEAVVRGVVQGVGFRWFVRREASALGLTGWVANEPDGSVRIVAEGGEAELERLLALLRRGPPGASVASLEADQADPVGVYETFAIRSGGHPGD